MKPRVERIPEWAQACLLVLLLSAVCGVALVLGFRDRYQKNELASRHCRQLQCTPPMVPVHRWSQEHQAYACLCEQVPQPRRN